MSQDVADMCKGCNVIVISDTYRLFPWAQVLYCGDEEWWHVHKGAPGFAGERWSSYNEKHAADEKKRVADLYGINLVHTIYKEGFSRRPDRLHYGANSGFAAVNLALHFGCRKIVMTGFDMRYVDDKAHWFGFHSFGTNPKSDFSDWISRFERAIPTLPDDVRIVNATPGSALTCFPMGDLADAIAWLDSDDLEFSAALAPVDEKPEKLRKSGRFCYIGSYPDQGFIEAFGNIFRPGESVELPASSAEKAARNRFFKAV